MQGNSRQTNILTNSLKFEKRKGTTDWGKPYEEQYFPVSMILKLLQNENVDDFRISANDIEFGDFDDFVLEIVYNNRTTEKYAIQLKHKENFTLTPENLKKGKSFSILNFYKTFQNSGQLLLDYKVILYTNAKFNGNDNTVVCLKDGNETVTVRVNECPASSVINTTQDGKSYKFQLEAGNSQKIKLKYKDFFDRFFLYSHQMNVHQLKSDFPQSFSMITKSSVADKFLKFIYEWSLIEGTKDKLTKDIIIKVITLNIVEEFIHSHKLFDKVDGKKKLLQSAISHFNITAFKNESFETVVKIWGDAKRRLRNRSIEEINEIIKTFQICTEPINNIDDLSDKQTTKLLWVMDECPLIIKNDFAAYEAAQLCGGKSKFIFITDSLDDKKLEGLTTFRILSDLQCHDATYNNILKNLSFTLFGEEINLENLTFDNLITTDDIAKIVDNLDLIKLEEEELCFPYVARHLYKNIIDSKYLQNVDDNTIVLVSNVSDEEKLTDGLQDFKNVSTTEELHKNTNATNQDHHSEKYRIFFKKTETSPEEFTSFCDRNKTYQKFYHFDYYNGHLEWIQGIGDNSDLKKFVIKSEKFLEDEELYAEKFRNNVNIVVAEPGMGKSVFVKKLKNKLLSEYFTVLIRPIDVPELCRTITDAENLQDFFTFIVQSKFSHCGNFEKQILQLLMGKGRAVFLWDALDELSEENRIFVEKLIGTVSKKSVAQFVTSRGFLQKHLEDNFQVLCTELQLFNDEQQNDYIQRRLQDICSGEELKSIATAIKENISKFSYREILGIPLQIYMMTELFRQDLEKYKKLFTELFVITDLYSYFIEEKFNFYFKNKKGYLKDYKQDRSLKRHIENQKTNYQKLALKLLFGTTFFEHPYPELDKFLDEIKNEGDEFGFITADDVNIMFPHNSWAEYFAATYFAENWRKITGLKNVIFERKYRNVRYFFDTMLAKDSPVHIAVLCKNSNYVGCCKDQDVLKRKDSIGRNALHVAASWGERYPLLETTDFDDTTIFGTAIILISDKIDFDTIEDNPEYYQIIDTLLKNCDLDEADQLFEMTPLAYAEKCECLFVAALIGKYKENQNYLKTKDETFVYSLLYYGIKYDFQKIVDLFENIKFAHTESGGTLLDMAVQNNQLQYLRKLLEQGHLEIVEYLLQDHANVNAVDIADLTPLHLAVENGHLEIVEYLLLKRAEVNAVDSEYLTPLHLAASKGHLEMVKYLIQENANVNAVDKYGRTPLHEAASRGNLETVKYLIQQGANLNAADKYDPIPLHAAAKNGHYEVVKYLIEKGANINSIAINGTTVLLSASYGGLLEIVTYLIEQNLDVDAANDDGLTPLMAASVQGHLDVVESLIKAGARVNAYDKHLETPLTKARRRGKKAVVQFLIKSGASVNSDVEDAETLSVKKPLSVACENGHNKVVEILLEAGADCETPANEGQTYVELAINNNHEDIAELLQTFKQEVL